MAKKKEPKQRRRRRDDSSNSDEPEPPAVTEDPIIDMDQLSMLERLPKELALQIIGYAPEAVAELRLTSRMLRSRVDDHIFHVTTPIVQELALEKRKYMKDDCYTLDVNVLKRYANLFELRLKKRLPEFNLHQRIKKSERFYNSYEPEYCEYRIQFDSFFDDATLLEYIRGCVGSRIRQVSFDAGYYDFEGGKREVETIRDLFEGMQIKKLQFLSRNISDYAAKFITQFIEEHNVERLTLDLRESTISDPVRMLLGYSSLLRSISIIQSNVYNNDNHLFADRSIDWSETIIEMLSRKLDKLYIENDAYIDYLSLEGAVELTKSLPRLDKPLWVSVSCDLYQHKRALNVEHNGTISRVTKITRLDPYRMLMIKHASRLTEQL